MCFYNLIVLKNFSVNVSLSSRSVMIHQPKVQLLVRTSRRSVDLGCFDGFRSDSEIKRWCSIKQKFTEHVKQRLLSLNPKVCMSGLYKRTKGVVVETNLAGFVSYIR